jgi:hypothetical protein
VAILASDLYSLSHFSVDVPIAVRVLSKVAINALHAEIDMDVLKMYGLLKLSRIIKGDYLAVFIEQVSLSITLVHGSKVPAVSVVIGELRGIKLWVEVTDSLEKIDITPLPANGRFLWIMK